MDQGSLEFLRQGPRDVMRDGPNSSTLSQPAHHHPVHTIASQRHDREWTAKMNQVSRIWGSAAAMRLQTERQLLSQFNRAAMGLPSSLVGLETVTGRDEVLEFEDFLNLPSEAPTAPKFTIHEAMEVKFGLL
mmetsp:Transcript_7343/g.11048  ORF Transcript_7343/g.11048 Transcript_7343/m.11048 type:complete len:132 (-) Transcript_7343:304-699(-)|eukprot:CAMPEP_0113942918 /NCGR_PEP_ID=MMETSP1339-20121228/14952_1 /TAXON_ID=94617 /ORGANISM="Fibrocapsa japonica" /LENGTH=131 /DNA_ID=CAMNT_0000947607 /DNA_START=95 /DNA_END=490 /DNA_ORIENTATION=+ /assembly_acc=CAM_ASM_000762